MRVSTGMIFDQGVAGINRQTASLLHLQQQVSSGRRILSPSDDPVGAAQALQVTQASDIGAQFKKNLDVATSSLSLEESQLANAGDVLAQVRDLAVQAGNTATLTASDRQSIATQLRSDFNGLLGIANATDGNGQSMFSGFMASTTPFAGSVDSILAGNPISYQGDSGQRTLQVSPSRFLEVSDSGNEVFNRIATGNGRFATGLAAANAGSGVIDAGSISNPLTWNAASTKNVAIRFSVVAGVTSYDLVDTASGNSLLTGGPGPAPVGNQRAYQAGQPIVLTSRGAEAPFDLGASVTITGAPANGDSFSIAPSSSQSVFATLAKLIGALEAPAGTSAANAQLSNQIGFALTNIDQAAANIRRVRTQVGSRLSEIESLANLNQDAELQYQQTLSKLQDIDYAKTISDLTQAQTGLQAAQQSFIRVSQLSLFNYL